LKTYAELTMASIFDAVTMMNAAAGQAPQIGLAMANMARALAASFESVGVDAALAKQLEPVGTIVSTMSGILDLISKLSEPGETGKMSSFLAMNLDALWFGIARTLSGMMMNLANGLNNVPDPSQFAQGQAALDTLTKIFESMTTLSAAMVNGVGMPGPGPGYQTLVPSSVSTGGYPTVPGASQVGGTASGKGATAEQPQVFKVEISWSTLTGDPSDREKRQIAQWLKPELQKMVDLAARAHLA
jgi:hypothetical protein